MKALISLLILSSTQAIKLRDDDYDFYSDAPASSNLDKDFEKLSIPDKPARASDSKPIDKKNVATGEAVEEKDVKEEKDKKEKEIKKNVATDEAVDDKGVKEEKDKKEKEIKKDVENDSTFFTS